MKFGKQLELSKTPEWADYYVSYSDLKREIHALHEQHLKSSVGDEEQGLLRVNAAQIEQQFEVALDKELDKVVDFYSAKFAQLETRVTLVLDPAETHEPRYRESSREADRLTVPGSSRAESVAEDDSEAEPDHDEHAGLDSAQSRTSFNGSMLSGWSRVEPPSQVNRTTRLTEAYIYLTQLQNYVTVNRTAFRKALKKYDKVVGDLISREKLQARYLTKVDKSVPFMAKNKDRLKAMVTDVVTEYARLATDKNIEKAMEVFRSFETVHVTFQRNTVFREMMANERRTKAIKVGKPSSAPESWLAVKTVPAGASLVLFLLLLLLPIFDSPEQQNCLAVVVFVSALWATEALPLFATSLLVPLLCVMLRVVRDEDGVRLGSKEAAKYVVSSMWTPVIILLLGGFTIAAAISKYDIDRRMATAILSRAGTRPSSVLLAAMLVAAFLSMWISNVAAPVLTFSVVDSVLRGLPAGSVVSQALVLGIALASNVGGMCSPIASPQNLVGLQNMDPPPGWGSWFVITLPVALLTILGTWSILNLTLRAPPGVAIPAIPQIQTRLQPNQVFIIAVTLFTIFLWVISRPLEPLFGDMGIIALLPMVVFFGSGLLTKDDFNHFPWAIIILAAGGLALGRAVSSSGLLFTVAREIMRAVDGLSLFSVAAVLSFIVLIIATFISHTVAALIFLPLIREVGKSMENPHPNLLVMCGVIMCSTAMGLPTSGFPNMTAIMKETPTGEPYLTVRHFLTRGVPASVWSFVVLMVVGYPTMLLLGM